MAEEITPAKISKELTKEIQDISSKIYNILQLKGIVRIDFIYAKSKLYFMEVNTVPGMSAASIIPQQVKAYGMTMKDIFSIAIEDAFNR